MQNDTKKILEIDSLVSNLYDRTKLIESSSGQGCKSPQVHHKDIWSSYFELHNDWKSLYDGPVLDSTEQ